MNGAPVGRVLVGRVLARALSLAGVQATYGRPLPGLAVTAVADPGTAALLATAHRAVHGVPAAAHLGDGRLVVAGEAPAGADGHRGGAGAGTRWGPADGIVVDDGADLFALGPVLAAAAGAGVRLHLCVDPGSTVPDGAMARPVPAESWPEPDPAVLGELAGAGRVVVLAGPGVVRRRCVGGLRALAAAGRLGVLNTWGAKGVFHWRSRHHWATVGLQERDLELGGLPDADLVLVVGIDEREAPPPLWARFPHRVVTPELLAPLAERWGPPPPFAPLPALRDRLASVTQAGWSPATPMMPSLVTRHYGEVLAGGGLVTADAGTAGYWVARTFPTTELGAVSVPPVAVPGWAAACVVAARLAAPLRPALAVVDGPVDGATRGVLDAAAGLGVAVGLEVWAPDGAPLDPEAHRARLAGLVDGGGGGTTTLATDPRQLPTMVEVAGPVRAWSDAREGRRGTS